MQWASTLAPEHIGIRPSKLQFVTSRRRKQSISGWICTCNASRGEEAEDSPIKLTEANLVDENVNIFIKRRN